MGKKDSSLTRVQPVFKWLKKNGSSGWYNKLLELSEQNYDKHFAEDIWELLPHGIKISFEYKLAPPEKYLKWLIQNPNKLTWPKEGGREQTFGVATQNKRKKLLGGDEAVQKEALQELEKNGPLKSGRKWWAFEGFTSVDCLLENEKIIIAIEGKRTEDGQSKSVSWYSNRDQLIRNIEAMQQKAGGKEYGVFLVDEKGNNPFNDDDFEKSLPHLSELEQQEIKNHFLGAVSWNKLIDKTGFDGTLPDTVDDVS